MTDYLATLVDICDSKSCLSTSAPVPARQHVVIRVRLQVSSKTSADDAYFTWSVVITRIRMSILGALPHLRMEDSSLHVPTTRARRAAVVFRLPRGPFAVKCKGELRIGAKLSIFSIPANRLVNCAVDDCAALHSKST